MGCAASSQGANAAQSPSNSSAGSEGKGIDAEGYVKGRQNGGDPAGEKPDHSTSIHVFAVPEAAGKGGKKQAAAAAGAAARGQRTDIPTSTSTASVQTDPVAIGVPPVRDAPVTMPSRWKKGESIGSGSFGTVHLGLNCDTGELLAVKEVAVAAAGGDGQARTTEAVQQLEREVALLSTLTHPNIVRYVGTQRDATSLYIFLEYVPGGSIASLLARFGPLEEAVVRIYTRQLLSGLAYLHAQRTVHRDVKGGNLLVEKTGRVKLADFGMAKQMVEQVQAIFKIASSNDLPSIPEHLTPEASEFVLLCLQRNPSARPSAEDLLKHPFVANAPRAVPALADPVYDLSYRYRAGQGQADASHMAHMDLGTYLPGAIASTNPHGLQGQLLAAAPGLAHAAGSMPESPLRAGIGQGGMPFGNAQAGMAGGMGQHNALGMMLPPSNGFMQGGTMMMLPGMGMVGGTLASGMMGGPNGAGGGMMSEDQLAAMVLGSSMLIAKARPNALDGTSRQDESEGYDFSSQPSAFRVKGLLSLPPLKQINAASLPPVGCIPLRVPVAASSAGVQAGGGSMAGGLRGRTALSGL